MKRLLLLSPVFFGYEEAVFKALSQHYEVTFVDNQEFLNDYRKLWNTSIIRKVLRRVFPKIKVTDRLKLEEQFVNRYSKKIVYTNDYYSKILCIKGDYFPDKLYERLRITNIHSDFLLYEWDDVAVLNKTSFFDYFNIRFSYNLFDCEKYGFKYLPMFVQGYCKKIDCAKKYDIAIIGTAHKSRVKFAKRMYKKYKNKYKFFIYFVQKSKNDDFFCHKTGMSYEEYLSLLAESRTTLEFPLKKQTGPTTRLFDSIITKCKVITTNKNLKRYDFNQNNMLYLNKSMDISKGFVMNAYDELNNPNVFFISDWVDCILDV